jgi:hypothetical protein
MSNKPFYFWTGILGIIAGLASVCLVAQPSEGAFRQTVLCFWFIVPPIWLFGEYYAYRFASAMTPDNIDYKRLKDSHDLAWKVWMGFALALAVLFLKS